jgi:AcrR family transcriptional regulator
MARPKEFDRNIALDLALGLFWEKGYGNTSTDMLLSRMQISRQSFYDTFGDKKQIYLEALSAYTEKRTSKAIQHLKKPESPLAGIEAMLLSYTKKSSKERLLGCMGVNAICEFGNGDDDVNDAMAEYGGRLIAAIEARLREAKARGEVADSLDVSAGAMYVNSAMNGMQISAKAGAPKSVLNAMVRFALDGIRHRD